MTTIGYYVTKISKYDTFKLMMALEWLFLNFIYSHFQYIEKTLDRNFLKKYSYKSISSYMDMTSSEI